MCRPSLVDVVPVKNEEGVVIMFILDFQELRERSQRRSGLRQRVARGWIYCACHMTASHDSASCLEAPVGPMVMSVFSGQNQRLKMRLPVLPSIRRPPLAKENFEGVVVDHLQVSLVLSLTVSGDQSIDQSAFMCTKSQPRSLSFVVQSEPRYPPEQQGATVGRKNCT